MRFYIKHHHTGTGTVPYRSLIVQCVDKCTEPGTRTGTSPPSTVLHWYGTCPSTSSVQYWYGTSPRTYSVQKILCRVRYCTVLLNNVTKIVVLVWIIDVTVVCSFVKMVEFIPYSTYSILYTYVYFVYLNITRML